MAEFRKKQLALRQQQQQQDMQAGEGDEDQTQAAAAAAAATALSAGAAPAAMGEAVMEAPASGMRSERRVSKSDLRSCVYVVRECLLGC